MELDAGEARYKLWGVRDGETTGAGGCAPPPGTARGSPGFPTVAFPGASPAVAWCHAPAEQRAAPAPAPG